jgi:hypothetical protein
MINESGGSKFGGTNLNFCFDNAMIVHNVLLLILAAMLDSHMFIAMISMKSKTKYAEASRFGLSSQSDMA